MPTLGPWLLPVVNDQPSQFFGGRCEPQEKHNFYISGSFSDTKKITPDVVFFFGPSRWRYVNKMMYMMDGSDFLRGSCGSCPFFVGGLILNITY